MEGRRGFYLTLGCGVFVALAAVTIAFIAGSVHTVQHGTVGVYFVNGKLADTLAYPGKLLCGYLVSKWITFDILFQTQESTGHLLLSQKSKR